MRSTARSTTDRALTRRASVRHLPNWYAQAHPEEDFAETFAVWLTLSKDEWKKRYEDWKALEKLEYVDALMDEARRKPPVVVGGPASLVRCV